MSTNVNVTTAIANAFREGVYERAKLFEEFVQKEVERIILCVIAKAREGKCSARFTVSGSIEAKLECMKRLAKHGIHGFVELGTVCGDYYYLHWSTNGLALQTREQRLVDFPIDDEEMLSRVVAWNVECIGGQLKVTSIFHAFDWSDKHFLAEAKENRDIVQSATIVLRVHDHSELWPKE